MKKCKLCNREYADETLNFCLDDGEWLLDGQSNDEPSTALFTSRELTDSATKAQTKITDQTVALPSASVSGYDSRSASSAEYIVTEVRNHKRGVAVALTILILATGFRYWFFKMRTVENRSAPINSIAVLPFQNKSDDADTDYLSDGLTESLIFRLSQLPGLKVSPTSSVIGYKGKDTDVSKIASELGVDSVMTGRIVKRGDNLNIAVELVDTRNNKSLWGEQYDRKL